MSAPTDEEARVPTEQEQQPIAKKRTLQNRRKEGHLIPSDENASESTSDDTWTPPSSEDETPSADVATPVVTRQLRSRGPVQRPLADAVNVIMDKVDEEIDNESDFSTTTDEDEEEEDDSDDDDDDEDDESDTEEDGYSDDDSFVTSGEEEDDDDEEEVTVPVPDPNNAQSSDPITTDELLADFGEPGEPA